MLCVYVWNDFITSRLATYYYIICIYYILLQSANHLKETCLVNIIVIQHQPLRPLWGEPQPRTPPLIIQQRPPQPLMPHQPPPLRTATGLITLTEVGTCTNSWSIATIWSKSWTTLRPFLNKFLSMLRSCIRIGNPIASLEQEAETEDRTRIIVTIPRIIKRSQTPKE